MDYAEWYTRIIRGTHGADPHKQVLAVNPEDWTEMTGSLDTTQKPLIAPPDMTDRLSGPDVPGSVGCIHGFRALTDPAVPRGGYQLKDR